MDHDWNKDAFEQSRHLWVSNWNLPLLSWSLFNHVLMMVAMSLDGHSWRVITRAAPLKLERVDPVIRDCGGRIVWSSKGESEPTQMQFYYSPHTTCYVVFLPYLCLRPQTMAVFAIFFCLTSFILLLHLVHNSASNMFSPICFQPFIQGINCGQHDLQHFPYSDVTNRP